MALADRQSGFILAYDGLATIGIPAFQEFHQHGQAATTIGAWVIDTVGLGIELGLLLASSWSARASEWDAILLQNQSFDGCPGAHSQHRYNHRCRKR